MTNEAQGVPGDSLQNLPNNFYPIVGVSGCSQAGVHYLAMGTPKEVESTHVYSCETVCSPYGGVLQCP